MFVHLKNSRLVCFNELFRCQKLLKVYLTQKALEKKKEERDSPNPFSLIELFCQIVPWDKNSTDFKRKKKAGGKQHKSPGKTFTPKRVFHDFFLFATKQLHVVHRY